MLSNEKIFIQKNESFKMCPVFRRCVPKSEKIAGRGLKSRNKNKIYFMHLRGRVPAPLGEPYYLQEIDITLLG